ncbi:MAG: bifunctional hydroxymethylpyrimidine kinase/phosphomethylpyrimidine kinase [Candidatus Obscuribacterales bacterium]|jgi:rfaE bifunctional protein kinase chain/domain|nr:bifunctional hydroxymethylpyrimidine kinase/phosphomethylpyrimidine kinase [Candidatus Obscuribacterales bacterium]
MNDPFKPSNASGDAAKSGENQAPLGSKNSPGSDKQDADSTAASDSKNLFGSSSTAREATDSVGKSPASQGSAASQEQAQKIAKEKAEDEKNLSKIDLQFSTTRSNTSLTYPLGQKGPFVLKKSEFLKPDHDKQVHELKNLISNFLNDTKLHDEHKLSSRELKELHQSRDELSSANDVSEAVQKALQLRSLYKEMNQLEEEKKARNLIFGLDPNNQVSKQVFKELERMNPQDLAARNVQVAMPENCNLTKSKLRSRINALTGGRVIVLGDLLIDELLEGRPERISREAPVLILEHVLTELILGGASNTASNLSALGGMCHAIGVTGRDDYAQKLARLFEKSGISYGLVEDPSRPTTVKTRILSSAHALRQQLLRMDRISHEKVNAEIGARILDKLKAVAGSYSALILSDYRGGLITDQIVYGCMSIAAEHKVQVVVDAQNDFARFKGAALITPNQPDTEAAVGFKVVSKETAEKAGRKMLEISGSKSVLLTRGGEGMILCQADHPVYELPAFNKSDVFDVTGAGDTVVATMTLAMVTGASMFEAMALGNLAAGIVVRKPGTAVTSQGELLAALDQLKIPD